MEFKVKSVDPKAHLLICSAISLFRPHIIDSGISSDKEAEFYGFFNLEGSPDLIDSLYHIPGIVLEIPRELPPGKDI